MIYDKKFLYRTIGILIALVALLKVTSGAGYLLVLPIAFGAFFQKKPETVLFWVAVSMTMVMGNNYLMPKSSIFMLSQRIMVMSFGLLIILQMAAKKKATSVKPFLFLLPYLFFMILPSSMGWMPLISFLKLSLFVIVYSAYLGISNEAALSSRASLPKMRAMLLAIAAFYIVGSILLIPFPAISQLSGQAYLDAIRSGRNVTSLFKGMSLHSQALGPMITMISIFLFADWVLAVRRWSWLHAGLFFLCPILIYKTSSRTAMGSFIFGILCVAYCVARERGIGARWRGKVKSAIGVFLLLLMVAVAVVPSLRDAVARYAMKWDQNAVAADFNVEGALVTRQGAIDSQLDNFKKKPVFGNGFQVAEYTAYQKLNSWKDYLSSPVEKGVWVTAILEEGGVVGMILFLSFLILAGFYLLAYRAYMALSMLVTMMVLNLGEFTLFSISAVGGFSWMLVFIAAAVDALRLRDDQFGEYQWRG